MSFKVLVIAEDPTNDRYILAPLAKALVADAGKPAAVVKPVDNPRLRGYGQAVQAIRHELADRYAMQDLRDAAVRLRGEAAGDVKRLRSRGSTQADFARALRETLGSGEDGPP